MQTVTFTAALGGDGESFQFVNVPEADMRRVITDAWYDDELKGMREIADELGQPPPGSFDTLSPHEVLLAAGCQTNKRYRFTVTAEEVT